MDVSQTWVLFFLPVPSLPLKKLPVTCAVSSWSSVPMLRPPPVSRLSSLPFPAPWLLFFKNVFLLILGGEEGRIDLFHVFIHSLCVPWPGVEPPTLVYDEDVLTRML